MIKKKKGSKPTRYGTVNLYCIRADPFSRKEWYDIKAPAVFTNRNVGKTVVNKTVGTSMHYFCLCDEGIGLCWNFY